MSLETRHIMSEWELFCVRSSPSPCTPEYVQVSSTKTGILNNSSQFQINSLSSQNSTVNVSVINNNNVQNITLQIIDTTSLKGHWMFFNINFNFKKLGFGIICIGV